MAQSKNPLFDTATVLGKIVAFLGVSAICGVLVAGLLVPAAAVTGTAASGSIKFFDELPGELKVDPPGQATKILASDGSLIANLYEENRTPVGLKDMSPFIKDGIVAIEDNRYYEHGGVDPTGIARALALTAQNKRQGASTITQQYVNNVINESLVAEGRDEDVISNGSEKKTVGVKLREMKLAIALEKHMSKEEILEGYLNIVFFNTNAYGIEAASRYFFSTTAKDLALPQAALLAGLVNSPTAYDPTTHPEASVQRRNMVLDAMLRTGKINQKQHDDAAKAPVGLKLSPPRQGCAYAAQAPYFCDYVQHLILNNPAYGETQDDRRKLLGRGGLTIKTTLDPRTQRPAQEQVNSVAGANPEKWGASLISVRPGTGEIVSMAQNSVRVGPESAFLSDYNFNLDRVDSEGNSIGGAGGMDPGSTMKPITFAAWLNEGKSMNTTLNASVRRYPPNYPWKTTCAPVTGSYDSTAEGSVDLQNNDEGYYRPMSVEYGLKNSINTATFATAAGLDDFCDIQRMADALHMHDGGVLDTESKKTKLNPLTLNRLSNLLGSNNVAPLTMASAFATFAADGKYCAPYAITSIKDGQGKDLPAQAPNCQADAIKPDVAKGVNKALQQVLVDGSGWQVPKVNAPAAAKTGTNNNNNQTWTVGYTRGLATASFFGWALTDPSSSALGRNVTINGQFYPVIDGSQLAGTAWANYTRQVAGLYDTSAFPEPPSELTSTPYVAPPPSNDDDKKDDGKKDDDKKDDGKKDTGKSDPPKRENNGGNNDGKKKP